MPPFIFNRMSQPLCSLPLPPPLPQVALLYLENYVQQMVVQQYVNQVTIPHYISNWQMYQPMTSDCPQQSIVPISNFPSYPPAVISNNTPMLPLQIPSSSVDVSQTIPYYNNNYQSTCRACTSPPPSYNSSITSNSFIQYCPICDQILGAIPSPNISLANEQITSSIRPASVLQNGHNQARPETQYPYMNLRSHKIPSLPPGAFIIFDEYITKDELFQEHHNSQIHLEQPRHINKTVKRYIKTQTNKKPLSSKVTIADSGTGSRQSPLKSKSVASSRSTYSLAFSENTKDKRTGSSLNTKKQNVKHEQRLSKAPKINFQSVDQPYKLATIHRSNSSNSDALRDLRLSLAIGDNQIDQLSTVPSSSVREQKEGQLDEKTNKSARAASSTPASSKISESQLSTIRESKATSPSIIKTTSYDTLTTVTDKTFDSISTRSVAKTDEQSNRNLSNI